MKSTIKKHILALALACYCLLAQWQMAWADLIPDPITIDSPDGPKSIAMSSFALLTGCIFVICIWIISFFILRWIKKKNDT